MSGSVSFNDVISTSCNVEGAFDAANNFLNSQNDLQQADTLEEAQISNAEATLSTNDEAEWTSSTATDGTNYIFELENPKNTSDQITEYMTEYNNASAQEQATLKQMDAVNTMYQGPIQQMPTTMQTILQGLNGIVALEGNLAHIVGSFQG